MTGQTDEGGLPRKHPMLIFSSPRLTRREAKVKKELDSYVINDIDRTQLLTVGRKQYRVESSVDLPDVTCGGLTFKTRLVMLKGGTCYVMARWKPDRYMRRLAQRSQQKWFLEKELFPPDPVKFLANQQAKLEQPERSSN